MAQVELKMPKMGESVHEATIIRWLKNEGENIDADESVLEIATDKVDSEVPSTAAGVLIKRLFNEGDVVQVGTAIAIIGSNADANSSLSAVITPAAIAPLINEVLAEPVGKQTQQHVHNTVVSNEGRFYSPLVRTIAATEGISQNILDSIAGTGAEGRVTKKDILSFIESEKNGKVNTAPLAETANVNTQKPTSTQVIGSSTIPSSFASGDVEIVEMDRMRKLIADHMVMSKHTSPHVTSFVEADWMASWDRNTTYIFED